MNDFEKIMSIERAFAISDTGIIAVATTDPFVGWKEFARNEKNGVVIDVDEIDFNHCIYAQKQVPAEAARLLREYGKLLLQRVQDSDDDDIQDRISDFWQEEGSEWSWVFEDGYSDAGITTLLTVKENDVYWSNTSDFDDDGGFCKQESHSVLDGYRYERREGSDDLTREIRNGDKRIFLTVEKEQSLLQEAKKRANANG